MNETTLADIQAQVAELQVEIPGLIADGLFIFIVQTLALIVGLSIIGIVAMLLFNRYYKK